VAHFDAAYDVVSRLLRGDTVTSHTKWWTIDDGIAVPEAVQTPVPPSWMAAGSDSSVEKAARLGLHCGTSLLTRAVVDARMAEFKGHWDRCHPDRAGEGKFAIGLAVSVAEKRQVALDRVTNEFAAKQEHFAHSITDTPGADDETYVTHKPNYEKFAAASIDELIDNHLLVAGTVEDCRDQVAGIRARGIDTIICHFHNPFSDVADSWRSFELFTGEVIPAVEGRAAAARAGGMGRG
jgi:alkanesulfonate monooxygenase SsuD/methylene tetrahydromethanopterin reductase-like flavin-dependent oxidoreductase (luciferase family)